MIINAAESRFLLGDYASIAEEQTRFDLPVTGRARLRPGRRGGERG
ncbi:hypothetical protein [Bradyrhizobium sp. USDA 4369]